MPATDQESWNFAVLNVLVRVRGYPLDNIEYGPSYTCMLGCASAFSNFHWKLRSSIRKICWSTVMLHGSRYDQITATTQYQQILADRSLHVRTDNLCSQTSRVLIVSFRFSKVRKLGWNKLLVSEKSKMDQSFSGGSHHSRILQN